MDSNRAGCGELVVMDTSALTVKAAELLLSNAARPAWSSGDGNLVGRGRRNADRFGHLETDALRGPRNCPCTALAVRPLPEGPPPTVAGPGLLVTFAGGWSLSENCARSPSRWSHPDLRP